MRISGSLFLSIVATLCLLASTLSAGQVVPDLEEKLQGKAAGEKVPVWIKLSGGVEPRALQANLKAAHSSRGERHAEGLRRLKEVHGERQRSLMGHLRSLEARGEAAKVKSRWLGNLVEAELTPGQIRTLARRPDVALVSSVPTLQLIEPEPAPAAPDGVQSNLTAINAHLAWLAGYTGAGRLVCSFDTGVDGDHPAITDRWKGKDGDSAAAWFDPRDQWLYPHTFGGDGHGTHVIGIMVGHTSADTIGVAPDAQWMSAAVIDIQGAPILDAFEWAADPDGDPNTVDDVPDVINHSWGIIGAQCHEMFYDVIDNLEALGIVNVFAAGNEGTVATAIRNPADRALDSVDCFAVGNVNHVGSPPIIWSSSSRGPSPCNGAIKPNVTAPGTAIVSSVPGGGYAAYTGTSMATPHVAGLVALMRQKNPDATADEIKAAILTSAPDHGYSLPDNTYGWGVIDCMAALNALAAPPAGPRLRVWAFPHDPISPGVTVTGPVILENRGSSVGSVSGTIIGSDPSLTVLDGSVTFGTAPAGDTVRSSDVISVAVSDTVSAGSILSVDFQITGSGYSVPAKLFFLVEPRLQRLQVNHDVNNLQCTITNFGTYGMDNGSFWPANGIGFRVGPAFSNEAYEASFMLSRNMLQVSDGARNAAGEPDGDFRVIPGGNIVLTTPGERADQETYARYDDSRAENSIGVSITQQTYEFADAANDDFVILRYVLTNTSGAEITNLQAGLYFDWDVVSYGNNAGGWEAADSVLWTAYNNGVTIASYRGLKVLDGPVAAAFTGDASLITYYDGGASDGWTESEKYGAMTSGFTTAETYKTGLVDLMQVLTAGPFTLPAGESDTVAFAVVTGQTLTDLGTNADAASIVYDDVIADCCAGIRGNINGDEEEEITVSDVTYLIAYVFRGGPAPLCGTEANVNGDTEEAINVSDLTYLIAYLWRGGPEPIACGVTVP